MKEMFHETYFNQSIGNWNVQNVANMNYMFYEALQFNRNIYNWNVQNVMHMCAVFTCHEENNDFTCWCVNPNVDMKDFFGESNDKYEHYLPTKQVIE